MKEKTNKINLKFMNLTLLCIILLGLLLRLINLMSPILDLYPIRQEQCAMIARNFIRGGFNIFNPQVDWLGNLNPYFREELPLISFLAAILYKLFGIHEFLGRLVAIFFSTGSIYLLYKLVRLYFDERTSIFSAFTFAVLPMSVYFGRTFMPESTMVFFSILSIYLFSFWVKNNKFIFFILSIFATTLTFLAKISAMHICLPLLFLFYIKYGKRFFLNWNIWLFFIIVAIPVILWYKDTVLKMSSTYIFNLENLKFLTYPNFYRRILESITFFALSPLGLFLCFFGFFIKTQNKIQYMFHAWLMAVIFYTLLYSKLNYTHYSYQVPLIAPASVLIGRSLALISDREVVKKSIFSNFLNTKQLITILLVILLLSSPIILRPCYKWNRATYEAACLINKLTPKNSIVIAGRCTQEASLYYCDRKGWVISEFGLLSYVYNYAHKDQALKNFPRLEEIELIKYLIKNSGANYYLAANLKAFNSSPELVKYMRSNFRILRETDKYIIFILR